MAEQAAGYFKRAACGSYGMVRTHIVSREEYFAKDPAKNCVVSPLPLIVA